MTERKFLATIPCKALFYILDNIEKRVYVIKQEKELGYDGYVVDFKFNAYKEPKYFFEASSFYIGKDFIQKKVDGYEFTNEVKDAVEHCMSVFPKELIKK